jgi:hypothetical protein
MKSFFLILFLNIFICLPQRHEITFNGSFGGATSIFCTEKKLNNSINNWNQYNYFKNINRKALSATYSFTAFNKIGLSFFSGIDIVNVKSKFSLILSTSYWRTLNFIIINKALINFKVLGVSKQIKFFNNQFSLNVGFSFIRRFFIENKKNYHIDSFKTSPTTPFVKYKYDLTTYFSKNNFFNNPDGISKKDYSFNLEYHLICKAKLDEKLFLNFGFTYTRNFIMFYEVPDGYVYINKTIFHTHIEQVGAKTNSGIKDDFLNFNIGLTYKFGKFKFKSYGV